MDKIWYRNRSSLAVVAGMKERKTMPNRQKSNNKKIKDIHVGVQNCFCKTVHESVRVQYNPPYFLSLGSIDSQ